MDTSSTTHRELLGVAADARIQFVETRLVGWIAAARPADAPPIVWYLTSM